MKQNDLRDNRQPATVPFKEQGVLVQPVNGHAPTIRP